MTNLWTYWEGRRSPLINLCFKTLKRHNPEVDILNDEKFVAIADDIPPRYHSLRANQKSDFVRSYVLQRYGGVWLDADCIHVRPLSPLWGSVEGFPCFAYRERLETPTNLCTAIVGRLGGPSAIIDEYHRTHRQLLRENRPIKRNRLGPMTLMGAVRRTPQEKIGLLDTRAVMPLHFWYDRDEFDRPMTQEEMLGIPQRFPDTFCFMLTHGVCGRFDGQNEMQILGSRTLVGYLLRKSILG